MINLEALVARALRDVLGPLPDHAAIDASEALGMLTSALERFVPNILAGQHPYWRTESLDAFRFAIARKPGPAQAEFIGLALMISDQTWAPIHLRLELADGELGIARIDCRLGEVGSGHGAMRRLPYEDNSVGKHLLRLPDRIDSVDWAYTVSC